MNVALCHASVHALLQQTQFDVTTFPNERTQKGNLNNWLRPTIVGVRIVFSACVFTEITDERCPQNEFDASLGAWWVR